MGDVPEVRAIEIATELRRHYGDEALKRARGHREDAIDAGRIGRADLYTAVCTIIADRDGVFTSRI